ncbi:hypothetical protein TNCV_4438831 [Trichonephila clavipes]|nr:hypothetical protein TNCV_4438831 [Trichonephila clavipes]
MINTFFIKQTLAFHFLEGVWEMGVNYLFISLSSSKEDLEIQPGLNFLYIATPHLLPVAVYHFLYVALLPWAFRHYTFSSFSGSVNSGSNFLLCVPTIETTPVPGSFIVKEAVLE